MALGESYPVGEYEQVRWFQAAVAVAPANSLAHMNLGIALGARTDLDGAVAEFREALRLDPKYAAALDGLSFFEPIAKLLHRLPDVLAGREKPQSPAEACDFALLCAQPFQKRYAAAVRLFAEAFAADPKLAEDLKAAHRYDAACYAALAAAGQGKDAEKQDDKARARLRGQALAWLRADLVLRRRQVGSGEAAQRREAAAQLAHWLADSDLAGVRPGLNRVGMPAEERAAWDALWADVKATLALAQKGPAATPGK